MSVILEMLLYIISYMWNKSNYRFSEITTFWIKFMLIKVMSFLAESSWAENQRGRIVDLPEKHKLAEKYFNQISLIGDRF
jgi:uncharacterized membrane protein YbhN (UPF0104 family)